MDGGASGGEVAGEGGDDHHRPSMGGRVRRTEEKRAPAPPQDSSHHHTVTVALSPSSSAPLVYGPHHHDDAATLYPPADKSLSNLDLVSPPWTTLPQQAHDDDDEEEEDNNGHRRLTTVQRSATMESIIIGTDKDDDATSVHSAGSNDGRGLTMTGKCMKVDWHGFQQLPEFVRVILRCCFWSTLCFTPAIVVWFTYGHDFERYSLLEDVMRLGDRANAPMELWRWSIYLVTPWVVAAVIRYFAKNNYVLLRRFLDFFGLIFPASCRSGSYYITGLQNYIFVMIASTGLLIGNVLLFHHHDESSASDVKTMYYYFRRTTIVMTTVSVLFLAQSFFSRKIAWRFQRSVYADRIQASNDAIRIFDALFVAAKKAISNNSHQNHFAFRRRNVNKPLATTPPTFASSSSPDVIFGREDGGSAAAAPPPLNFDKITRAIDTTLKLRDNPRSYLRSANGNDIFGKEEANRVAKIMYDGLTAGLLRNYLLVDDFKPWFRHKDVTAATAFALFDREQSGRVSSRNCRNAIRAIFRERRNIMNSLKSLASCVSQLNSVLVVLTLLMAVFISIPVFGVDVSSFIASIVTLFVGFGLVFGNSLKGGFECMIFLFVMHPYDVGDRVFIDGENLVVREMHVLMTIFLRMDGQLVHIPNSYLQGTKIYNARRSPPQQSEIFHLYLDLHTPESKIEALRERLDDFTREHSHDVKDVIVSEDTIDGKEAAIKMWVSLRLQHNLQNNEYRYKFRSKLWLAIKIAMNELAIEYMPPENRVRVMQGHYPDTPLHSSPMPAPR